MDSPLGVLDELSNNAELDVPLAEAELDGPSPDAELDEPVADAELDGPSPDAELDEPVADAELEVVTMEDEREVPVEVTSLEFPGVLLDLTTLVELATFQPPSVVVPGGLSPASSSGLPSHWGQANRPRDNTPTRTDGKEWVARMVKSPGSWSPVQSSRKPVGQ